MRPRRQPTGRSTPAGWVERLQITGVAAGGAGVGRTADGRAIFVHRTAPGEVVEAEIVEQRQRWARGRLLRVLETSPDRRAPLCPHYADCGGCTLEHIGYPAQLRIKARIVGDALRRIGRIEVNDPEVVPSPSETRYRNRVSFALRRLGEDRVVAGFHSLHDPGRIVPIDGRCLLPEEPIGAAWDALRGTWGPGANRLPSGERLRLTLRTSSAGALSLLIEGGYSDGRPAELLDTVPNLESIWHRRDDAAAEHVAGAPGLPETWGEERFELGGSAFLQVNRAAAVLLEQHVMEVAGAVHGRTVVDAYCGIGLHARRLALAGARVVGIELDPDAVRVAAEAAPPTAEFRTGRVEELLADALPADLLILNPPRAGLEPAAIGPILSAPPARIVYVSCDPATLARDLGRLGSTFAIDAIRCFDLFPQTAHVESVVVLSHSS